MAEDNERADAEGTYQAAQAASPTPRNVKQEAAFAVRKLLIEDPLYRVIEGDEAFIEAVDKILNGNSGLEFDLYCANCDQVTPWTIRPYVHSNTGGGTILGSRYVHQARVPDVRVVNAVCLRKQHFYVYLLHRTGLTAQKIGQRPSLADIAHGELKTIPGIDKADRREIGRALGLYAHDTPLGAFVYLRRVFERMIERAHTVHKEKHGSPIAGWEELRMGERISMLSDELPSIVSTNKGVWGLLSKGIHELSDDDAAGLFPLVKAVIFEMLGEEERKRQADRQRVETQKALDDAIARFGPKS